MAAARNGWGITRKASENIEFTYKWAIEEFDFAMGVGGDGKLESPRFRLPGVSGEFHILVERKHRSIHIAKCPHVSWSMIRSLMSSCTSMCP